MKKNNLVYIAGPISAPTLEEKYTNIDKGKKVAELLAEKGINFFCPHTHSADFGHLAPVGFWYEQDLKFLAICDLFLLLPGWEDSKGCLVEKEFAVLNNKKIFYSIDDLLNYLDGK